MSARPLAAQRAARAFLVLAAFVAAAVAVDAALKAGSPGTLAEAGSLAFRSMLEEAAGAPSEQSQPQALPGFEDEVVSLAGCEDVRVGAGGSVVGFVCSQDPDRAFSRLAEELGRRGWTQVPSGLDACGSFVKDGGSYRWALVSCIGTGSKTSVVVQCATTEER